MDEKFIKTIKLKEEWYEDIDNPEAVINSLKELDACPDIFSFWQRLPETRPKYKYHMEWESLGALPISSFEDWWTKQINDKTRNMARKAEKKGVTIKEVEFDDEFVRGIMRIFNESPVKRGKPFRHYNKDFETVKKEMSDRLDSSQFIGAYYENELVGFLKLNFTDRYAMMSMLLSLQAHRDKSPINALLAKAVRICAERKIPYITYVGWRRGEHGDFQRRNGFQKVLLPRYYIPLTMKGKAAFLIRMHRGLKGIIPDRMMTRLLALRKWWYERFVTSMKESTN